MSKTGDIREKWRHHIAQSKRGARTASMHMTVVMDDAIAILDEIDRLNGIIKGQILENNELARQTKAADFVKRSG